MKTIEHHIDLTTEEKIRQLLEEVNDPEVPVLSVIDLGIIRDVQIAPLSSSAEEGLGVQITPLSGSAGEGLGVRLIITPTYSGCPAMDVISMNIRLKLFENGYHDISIHQQLSPAWTTDWMTEEGKQKLKEYGIAPPNPKQQFCTPEMFQQEAVQCPHCNSYHTELISQFGSTACKALYRCLDCKEAFDYFKCH